MKKFFLGLKHMVTGHPEMEKYAQLGFWCTYDAERCTTCGWISPVMYLN